MNLPNFLNKIKAPEGEWYWFVLVVMVGLFGFGLGRLSKLEDARPAISVESGVAALPILPPTSKSLVTSQSSGAVLPSQTSPISTERVYASKTGKRYYYSWCKSQVKEENKIWYENTDQAKAKGLTLGVGCREPF